MALVLQAARHILNGFAVIEMDAEFLTVREVLQCNLDLDTRDGTDDIRDIDAVIYDYLAPNTASTAC